jgi:hypothetical protein
MATHDYVIDDQTTPAFRSDLNNALAAIATNNSSTSAPATTYAGLWWLDTTNNYLKIRDKNDANWIIVGEFDVTNSRFKLISDSLKAASAGGIDVLNSSGTKIIDLQVTSQATAEAGTNNTELMTPLRTAQAIASQAKGLIDYALYTSSSTFAVPAGTKKLIIRASGGGGGGACLIPGSYSVQNGSDGGDTTVTQVTLGISVTAKGGNKGLAGENTGASGGFKTGSTGGTVLDGGGSNGGQPGGHSGAVGSGHSGGSGSLVVAELDDPTTETISFTVGAGGAPGNASYSTAGTGGFVEFLVFG